MLRPLCEHHLVLQSFMGVQGDELVAAGTTITRLSSAIVDVKVSTSRNSYLYSSACSVITCILILHACHNEHCAVSVRLSLHYCTVMFIYALLCTCYGE
jgi:hypothetical protein